MVDGGLVLDWIGKKGWDWGGDGGDVSLVGVKL